MFIGWHFKEPTYKQVLLLVDFIQVVVELVVTFNYINLNCV